LTFGFPPRTALIGLVGAVLGTDRERLPEDFKIDKTSTAVIPLSPLIKDRLPQNWRQGPPLIKGNRVSPAKFNESFQANLEVVRRPQFAVVLAHRNVELMNELEERLRNKRWFYPPYLGSLGFLADIEFEQIDEATETVAEDALIDSVLPLTAELADSVTLHQDNFCIREEGIPLEVLHGRAFKYLATAYVEKTCKPLRVTAKEGTKPIRYHHLEKTGKNVVFFESCAR